MLWTEALGPAAGVKESGSYGLGVAGKSEFWDGLRVLGRETGYGYGKLRGLEKLREMDFSFWGPEMTCVISVGWEILGRPSIESRLVLHVLGHAACSNWGLLPEGYCIRFYCHKHVNHMYAYVNHRYAASFIHRSAVLSCLPHDLHKTVITKCGADTSGCIHA